MNITRLLKQNKTLCVAFSEEEKAEFSKKLFALGFLFRKIFLPRQLFIGTKRFQS